MKDQVAMFSYDVKSLTAQIYEMVKLSRGFVTTIYNIGHVRGQDERCPIPGK